MTGQDWWSLFTAAFSGGAIVKLFDIAHQEYRTWKAQRSDQSKSVDQSLEPLLRAADELVGKLRSLAEQDFIPLHAAAGDDLGSPDVASTIYLFVQFWSEVEIVRFRGLSTAVAKSERGKQTQAFLACLESRRVRLIDRISQRALGEAALKDGRTMNFVEFVRATEGDPYMQRWLAPLIEAFAQLSTVPARQKVLQYAVVLHALIDTLDRQHLVTRDRPATPNKLNKKSRRDLHYRVFGIYLAFVRDQTKYIGPLI